MLAFSLCFHIVKLKEYICSFSLSPDRIFQSLIGFWGSKTLLAAVELELFTKLSGGKQMTLNELQKVLGIEPRLTVVFISALASYGLLQVGKQKKAVKVIFEFSGI
jgi:hypothetical protein